MNIINIGTYLPKQCGIATFSSDLCSSIAAWGHDLKIIAISDNSCNYHYSNQVIFNIRQNHRQDYRVSPPSSRLLYVLALTRSEVGISHRSYSTPLKGNNYVN